MPLVRISLNTSAAADLAVAVGAAVHAALVETIRIPVDDKFQIITRHEPGQLVFAPEYLGIAHTDALVIIQITLSDGRSVEQKRALFAKIADLVEALGIPRADVFVNLVEVAKENWSFGNGLAQYAN